MSTATMPTAPSPGSSSPSSSSRSTAARVATLAATETKLVVRNRTLLIGSVIVPLALGVFWLFTFSSGRQVVPPLQFGMAIGLGVYVTATQTLVARRHSLVLKRFRTTGLPDNGILLAVVTPAVVVGVVLLAVFTVLDAVTGVPLLTDPLPLLLGVVTTMAMVITAGMATAAVTPAPERTNVTTLPLSFLLLGSSIAMTFAPVGTWWDAVLLVPGAGLGRLVALAGSGATWMPDVAGLPAVALPVVSLLVWTAVFGALARRWFRWDRRS